MTWSRATAIAGSAVVTLACCRIRIVRGHRELPRDCGIRLDQSKAEKARVEVDIGLGVDGDCRHVVKAANGFSHGVHLACTTLANVRGSLLSLFDEGQQIGVDVVVRLGKRLDAEVFLEFGGICNFGGVVEALASLIPCLRHRSAVFIPASCSFRMAMICSSVCLLRFIVWSFLRARLQFTLDQFKGGNVRTHAA
jgi:hypothetical protein